MKINAEGYVAIVHDAMSSYQDTIPWLVAEDDTLNWFRVFWDTDFPGSSETNTCEMNKCKTVESDGSCLCQTNVVETTVFTDLSVTKEDVMSQLFIDSSAPQAGRNTTNLGEGVWAHLVGSTVDADTIFEVHDKNRTLYLKNMLSTVELGGWEHIPPQIYEAEDAIQNNTVSSKYITILYL